MPESVRIHCITNAISGERVQSELPASGSLSDHLRVPSGFLIERNGRPYNDEKLHPGDLITLTPIISGGSEGKDIARTAIVLAAQIGTAALTAGLGNIAQAAITTAVTIGTRIGVNALIPPPQPTGQINSDSEQFKRLGSLTGSRNRITPYTPIPKIFGKRKVYPPMSARPFTEILGNHQYQRLLFAVNQGACQLSEPKIGDTIIGSFDSENQFTSNGAFESVEIDVAENPTLYSSLVNEQSPGVSFTELFDEYQRTTADNAQEISVDLTFPQGLFTIGPEAETLKTWVYYRIDYRLVGNTTWIELDDSSVRDMIGLTFEAPTGWKISGDSRETKRAAVSWAVDSGQYEVKVSRISVIHVEGDPNPADISSFHTATWSALRAVTFEEPTDLPGVVQLGMRIKSTDQLHGVLDEFSVVVESRLPYYDGAAWQDVVFNASNGTGTGGILTSNPAWIMANLLTGEENPEPIARSRIDETSFKSWADNCEAEGRFCNLILDNQKTVFQIAQLIGSTGRGSLTLSDKGIYQIIQDLDESVPVQHFTPKNSSNFSAERAFPTIPHALRVNFVNPDQDWQADEMTVYYDGYSLDGTNCEFPGPGGSCEPATIFETVDLEGVTSSDQAWKEGRYRLAEMRLRPAQYSIMADIENLICTRGDTVFVQHDVTLWGINSGRIKSVSGSQLVLDEEVTMVSGEVYQIRVRNDSNQSQVLNVTTDPGTHTTITVDSTANVQAGNLFSFGKQNAEGQLLKVSRIEPTGELKARITMVDAAPEIYQADQGVIPPFNSNITRPPYVEESTGVPNPIITAIRSNYSALYPGANKDPQLKISVSFQVGSGGLTEIVEGRFRRQDDDEGWTSFGSTSAETGTINLFDVEKGGVYIIQIRGKRGQLRSDWVEGDPHTAGEGVIPYYDITRFIAIGSVTQEYVNATVTEIALDTNLPVRSGVEYWVVNEAELSRIDPLAGIYPFIPEYTDSLGNVVAADDPDAILSYGPGLYNAPVESVALNVPNGALVYRAPAQDEIEKIVFQEKLIAVRADLTTAEGDIQANANAHLSLSATVTQQGDDISANSTAILAAEARLTTNEGNIQANANSILTLDSTVQTNSDNISANATAILSAETRITNNENGIQASADARLILQSEINVNKGELTNIKAKAALIVDANGVVGSINLAADGITGFSSIDLKASQVTANGVRFDNEGAIYNIDYGGTSLGFDGGITGGTIDGIGSKGWAIDRTGYMVAHKIDIRVGGKCEIHNSEGINVFGHDPAIDLDNPEKPRTIGFLDDSRTPFFYMTATQEKLGIGTDTGFIKSTGNLIIKASGQFKLVGPVNIGDGQNATYKGEELDSRFGTATGADWPDITNKPFNGYNTAYFTTSNGNLTLVSAKANNWDAAYTHIGDSNNPHSVNKSDVGLSQVLNYSITDSYTTNSSTTYASAKAIRDHHSLQNNPHNVTKSQLGLDTDDRVQFGKMGVGVENPSGGSNILLISGNVYIGGGGNIQIEGTSKATNHSEFTSDRRLKTNIVRKRGLDYIGPMKLYRYEMNGMIQWSIMAQDVQEAHKELVGSIDHPELGEVLTVKPMNLVSIALDAIRELHIDHQEALARIRTLEEAIHGASK